MNDHRRLESLISALCDGTIDPPQLAQLEEMLRNSAECRRFYLQYIDMHARLTVHPHLRSGIPLAETPQQDAASSCSAMEPPDDLHEFYSPSRESDDEIVLELARASLDRLSRAGQQPRNGRRFPRAAGWISLAAIVLCGLLAWQAYERWNSEDGGPVIRELSGAVTITAGAEAIEGKIGYQLRRGDQLTIGAEDAHALLAYPDGTTIAVRYDSQVEVPADTADIQLRLLSGTMEVDAAPQPPQRPLVFSTDHARYVVLGARFRLYRAAEASRLELDEGKVRLESEASGKAVEVNAGQVAVATARPAPVEIRPLSRGTATLRASLRKAGEAACFLPDGSLATGDWRRGLKTWTVGQSAPTNSYEAKIGRTRSSLAFDGKRLVYVSSDKKKDVVAVWQPGERQGKQIALSDQPARSRAVSPDGLYAVESCKSGTRLYQIDAANAKRKQVAELPDKGKAWCMSLSRSAQFAGAGFWDGTIRVHRSPAAKNQGKLEYEIVFEKKLSKTVTKIALSEDGSRLAAFTRDDGLQYFDLGSGESKALWDAGAADVSCLKFSSDGQRLIAGLNDETARIWAVPRGQALLVVDVGHTPRDVAWSETASLLATAGNQVKIWDCEIPKLPRPTTANAPQSSKD